MAIILGENKGISSLRTFSMSPGAPREVALGSSLLPNAEGATNQVSFTIQDTDLPTISPAPYSMKFLAQIVVSGKNGATAPVINFRIFKNGVSLVTGVSTSTVTMTANNYWTTNHWRWFDVQVGDVLEVRLWASNADTTIDYAALQVYPANIYFVKPSTGLVLKDLAFSTQPAMTHTGAGVRTMTLVNTGVCIISTATNAGVFLQMINAAISFYALSTNPTVGQLRMQNGGDTNATTTQCYNRASDIALQRNGIPTSVSFREIR